MRHLWILSVLVFLTACPAAPTLRTGDEAEIQVYLAPNGDAIVEAPRPVDFGTVRLAADSVDSPFLASPVKSEYGYYRLTYPDEENAYLNCLRIKAKNVTAGWAGLTMIDGDYSEAQGLDTRKRRPPRGC